MFVPPPREQGQNFQTTVKRTKGGLRNKKTKKQSRKQSL